MTTPRDWKTHNGFGDEVFKVGSGHYTKSESETVRMAILDYCAGKRVDYTRLCSECEHKPDLKGAWTEIAKSLPHRSVQSVYRHGIRIMHPFNRGPWSEDDINRLFELVARLGKKWVAIQNQLNRSADACRDKYRECCQDYKRGRWKDDENAQLEQLIRDHLKVDPKATLLDIGKMIEAEGLSLPWDVFSRKIGNRSRLSCFRRYQKLCGVNYPDPRRNTGKRKAAQPAASVLDNHEADQHDDNDNEPAIEDVLGDITGDEDMYLLSELVETGCQRAAEVPWETLNLKVDEAQTRWNMLIMEWQEQEGEEATEEALTTLPLYELAQLLLDRKNSAKTAEETLEAVDLPIV